jgi:hypothetical protein
VFETRQMCDRPPLVRTFGKVIETEKRPLLASSKHDAIGNRPPPPPGDCARGKVAIYSTDGDSCDVGCYQLDERRPEAALVACGNATAAAAAAYAGAVGRRELHMRVGLPGGNFAFVDARVDAGERGADMAVHQTWRDLPFSITGRSRVRGRRCALCVGPLNNYVVVRLRPTERVDDFTLSEALTLWKAFGLERKPLLSRLAVVQCDSRPVAVRFFTCGERAHPSAPLTGLAVLALAGELLDWLGVETTERVLTDLGLMDVPHVQISSAGTASVTFPPVLVGLTDDAPGLASASA